MCIVQKAPLSVGSRNVCSLARSQGILFIKDNILVDEAGGSGLDLLVHLPTHGKRRGTNRGAPV